MPSLSEKRRVLVEFKVGYLEYLHLQMNHPRAQEIREKLNRSIPFVIAYLRAAGIDTAIHYSPPPAVGGLAGRIDVFANLFQLGQLMLRQNPVHDMLDRGIGMYDYWIENQWKKWVNPLYWIGEIIRLPFMLLDFAGFNSLKVESSIFGKIYKLIASIVGLAVGVIELYKVLKPLLESRFGITLPSI